MTPTWEGHEPDTSARLLDVLVTATTGSAKVSRSDRILFVACEFWAAARNRSLLEQLSADPIAQLRAAEEAFHVIGLPKVAGCLRLGRLALTDFNPPIQLKNVAENIESWLEDVDEPVDQVIAEFAKKQASERQSSAN
ncbi:MAG TPA: hypothetical protein VGO37_10075 [Steroidobacteraceae bacterium]|jgi:hypothetical protein|nr:hypothetical protein [Steroidobacteraceae bacterium]